MNPILSVENVKKSYHKVQAVKDISFNVRRGECFGLLGPNGAGKSTTMEMIQRLITPDAGRIQLFDQPLSKQMMEKIGVQHQNTSLPLYLTVRETLDLFRNMYANSLPLDDVIDRYQLKSFQHHRNDKISGGQKQRLLFAMAMVHRPELVLLDEPTTGLDPQARRHLWSMIEQLKAQEVSVLLTTHYMEEAQLLCDRLAIVDQGEIIIQGETSELLDKFFQTKVLFLPYSEQALKVIADKFEYGRQADQLKIYTEDIQRFIDHCSEAKLSLDSLEIRKFNLEDLFLKLTGHSLRE